MKALGPSLVLTAILLTGAASAQKSVTLQARSAGDLAELCAASAKDPLGDAKINFCHGFAQGAISTELREGKKTFCFPNPAPTRTATMSEFVGWVRANGERRAIPAVDGLFRFLSERFACK